MSPSEPPTVLEVEGCNSRRFWAIANSKHVLDSSTITAEFSKKCEKKSKTTIIEQKE